jgi:superfamily II DNA or RNA helicase/HJR/Mrr/RecB family endonuclease
MQLAECFRLQDLKNHELILLCGPPKTHQVLLSQLAGISQLKLLGEVANCQFFVPLKTLPDADCLRFLEEIPQISGNLFEPLGRTRSDGKRYGQPKIGQRLFPFETPKPASTATDYKRSYTETKREDGGFSRQGMSIWDLLLPLLQPSPVDLASGQVVFLPSDLQPHQPEGVRFLATNSAALLGDGVQTGKTIQAVVAMKLLFQSAKVKNALVVCPISVLMHWQKQLEKWAPELWQGLTVVRSPSKEQRRNMWRMPAHVYVTNYETVVNDFDEILELRCGSSWLRRGPSQSADTTSQSNNKGFDLIVADEIQRIKNPATAVSKNIKELGERAQYRWGLSATPVENTLDDLVSIFEFLKLGLLRRGVETELSVPSRIKPHFLRRRTQDIAKNFKEPRYDRFMVEMEGRQLEAYEQAFRDSVAELRQLGEQVTLAHALAKLQALKQLCNVHLASDTSAKLDWLSDWLEDIVASENKVLVFSQYREFGLDYLAKKLGEFGCVHYGQATSDASKRAAIDAFCNDPKRSVFLANPATAGTGLPDLKEAANYVVHFDHWWNPAREDQANGRILGIGQRKNAFIAHLWVENSVEGKIETILARKRDLFGRVIDSQTSVAGANLSAEEVFGLFGLDAPTQVRRQQQPEKPPPGPESVASLLPSEFEHLVGRVYKRRGYAARVTGATRDGGIDVIAVRDFATGREKLAIQCKHQRESVGRPDLQKLLGVISADPSYTSGVLVTSARFSGDAHEFASQNGRLQLIDGNALALLLHQLRIPLRE